MPNPPVDFGDGKIAPITNDSNVALRRILWWISQEAQRVNILDGSGNVINSFGGGTQYNQGQNPVTPTGTLAFARNASGVVNSLIANADGALETGNTRKSTFGSITEISQNVSLTLSAAKVVAVQVTGTWSGTLQFEGSIDGTNFFSVQAIPSTGSTAVTNTGANGNWALPCQGFSNVRLRSSSWGSGTATINIVAADGLTPVLASGGGGGGGTQYAEGDTTSPATGNVILARRTSDGSLRIPTLDSSSRLQIAPLDYLVDDVGAHLFDFSATGVLGALNDAVTVSTEGKRWVIFTRNTTAFLTYIFEGFDGTSWRVVQGGNINTSGGNSWSTTLSGSSNHLYTMIPCGGFSQVRVRVSAYTSGSSTGTVRASACGDWDTFFSAQYGTMPLNTQLVDRAADLVATDGSGNVKVNLQTDGGGILSSLLTTAAFQARINTLGQKTMANSTPVVFASDQSTLPNNQTQIAGNSIAVGSGVVGTGVQRVVLATDVALPTGANVIGGVTQSGTWNINNISGAVSLPTGAATEATLSTLNGKVTACNTGAVTISAALPTGSNTIGSVASITTSVTPGTAAANLGKAEDAAHVTGDTGVAMLAVRRDTPISGTSADGDYSTINTDPVGHVYVNSSGITPTVSAVAAAGSSTTLFSAVAGRKKVMVFNDSSTYLYIRLGTGAASTTDFSVGVPPQGFWVEQYSGDARAIGAGTPTGNWRITEIV